MILAFEKARGSTEFIEMWKNDYLVRAKVYSGSRKSNYTIDDALKTNNPFASEFDIMMLEYLQFMDSDPLKDNDYHKYISAYVKGKTLDPEYFKHDLIKLKDYYNKIDKNPDYSPFNLSLYSTYVLYMMLKLKGHYKPEFDNIFGVKLDKHREYNPLTSIPSVLRSELPFDIMEYDIIQAYPSFIFSRLDMKPFNVYEKIGKRELSILLNSHRELGNIDRATIIQKLTPIFGDRIKEILTEEIFNHKGKLFEEFSAIEEECIQKFVLTNNLKNYVRLHDGVVMLATDRCKHIEYGKIKFKVKEFRKVPVENKKFPFYEFIDGKLCTSPALYKRFFEQENFIRVTRPGHDEITILKNSNRILKPINYKTDLVSFLKEKINEFDSAPIEDRIVREMDRVIAKSLLLLNPVPLQYHRDSEGQADFPFNNGIVRVKPENIELIDYDNIDGFFPEHDIQKHKIAIDEKDDATSDFYWFLCMVATGKNILSDNIKLTDEDENKILAFCTMFGYLITNHKNEAFNPAIILSDQDADGINRNGGRGKSLVQKALTYFRKHIYKGGNAYDPNYTFVHADLEKEHDIYILDDVPPNFDYNALYTGITGPIAVQRKRVVGETIPFEESPKFVISTNWVIRYDNEATSTNRRFREFQFSDFFSIDRTPDEIFGKKFFQDWNKDEWNSFFNFGFQCVQAYQKNGLMHIKYNKETDNFKAHFSNDAILDEMERIIRYLEDREEFSVTDFLEIHKQHAIYVSKPEFNVRNSKKLIDVFIIHTNLPYKYEQRTRKWKRLSE